MRFLSSPRSCSFEVMPGTLRNICMSVSLWGFQEESVRSSTGTSTMSWCVLDSSLYWRFRLWRLRRFLVVCARFVCRGWEGSLLSFSPWVRILRLLLLSSGSTLANFFHVMHWSGFLGSKYDLQSHVLDFVQPVLVGLGNCSPRSECILYSWSYCCCVDFR